jgi:hypothetical protein
VGRNDKKLDGYRCARY